MRKGNSSINFADFESIGGVLPEALEKKGFISGGHANRVQELTARLAKSLGMQGQKLLDLNLFTQFHDIGKIGVPERILFKPGPLTEVEWVEMKRHCEIGYRMALKSPMLLNTADLILKHHESWNGKGYPLQLQGEEIPLECRMLSIADAYDAMTNDRPYRKALAHREAVEELQKCAGTQFDPYLVEKFMEILR